MEGKSQVQVISEEIKRELSTESVARALMATTFKKMSDQQMRQALMEGMMLGFKFENFLRRDVYAIPYGNAYSLITSISYARKIGMRSGVVGVSAPTYEMSEDGKKIISCTVTVKRKIGEYVGDYTATVFFDEYDTGQNLWKTKPKTMIAKVAEMHALRKACPEELSVAYIEEEMIQEASSRIAEVKNEVEKGELSMGKFKTDETKDSQEENAQDQSTDAGGAKNGKEEPVVTID